MKHLSLITIIIASIFTSLAQQRDTINQQVKEDNSYDIDSVIVVKQRFIKVRGFTKDDNGKILADVTVTHGNGKKQRRTISDKDGYFVLDSVRSGYPMVRFTKQGYMTLAYKFNNYDVEQVILAFDPNGTLAEYDLGYFKDSKLKSATAVRVIRGNTLRKYGLGGRITPVLQTLLGARSIGLVVVNNMKIVPDRGQTIESILDTFNVDNIDLVAYLPPYSGNSVLYGMTSSDAGILVVRLKQN